jgi:hypothetical protein
MRDGFRDHHSSRRKRRHPDRKMIAFSDTDSSTNFLIVIDGERPLGIHGNRYLFLSGLLENVFSPFLNIRVIVPEEGFFAENMESGVQTF